MQVRKRAREGIHCGFETKNKLPQKFKIGVSVTPQKGVLQKKKLLSYWIINDHQLITVIVLQE